MKNDIFIKKEYKSILSGILLFYCVAVAGEFVDLVVAGQFLGEASVEAVEIVSSITFLYGGVALLISTGFQILHSREMGKFDNKSASNVFLQALFSALIFGTILFIFSKIFINDLLKISGCTGKLFSDAKQYFTFFPYIGLLYSIGYIFTYLVVNDGNIKILILSAIGTVVTNIILSIAFANTLGLKGLGLASVIGVLVQALILLLHFFSKSNSIVKCKINIDIKLMLEMLKYGIFSLLGYASIFVVDIILHNFILGNYKEGYLTSYAIVNLFLDFGVVFEAFSEAGTAVAGVYMGEKNFLGVKKTLRVYLSYLLMMGVVFTLIFVGLAPYVPKLYAIETTEFYEAAKMTSIIMGFSGIVTALLYAPMNMYSCLGHPYAGAMFSFLFNGVFPVVLGIPLGLKFGYIGIVFGIALSPVATLIFAFTCMIIIYGIKDFPYYLGINKYKTYMYCINSNITNSDENILNFIKKLKADEDISENQHDKIFNSIKSVVEKIIEINEKTKIIIEISVMVSKDIIKIIFRNNGKLSCINKYELPIDTIDEEKVQHLITTSINRNIIVIRRD